MYKYMYVEEEGERCVCRCCTVLVEGATVVCLCAWCAFFAAGPAPKQLPALRLAVSHVTL